MTDFSALLLALNPLASHFIPGLDKAVVTISGFAFG